MNDLENWLQNLEADFSKSPRYLTPSPSKVDSIVRETKRITGATPTSIIGSGDNAIALLSDKNTALKYTIDEKESKLWSQFANHKFSGLAQCYGCWQLTQLNKGPTIVYLIHVEYVPHPLSSQYVKAIRTALDDVLSGVNTTGKTSSEYTDQRTASLINKYQELSLKYKKLGSIIKLLQSLKDLGIDLYDLGPDNIRMTSGGDLKVVDPSVPDGSSGTPKQLVFERRIDSICNIVPLLF